MTQYAQIDLATGIVLQCINLSDGEDLPPGFDYFEVAGKIVWDQHSPTSVLKHLDGALVWVETATIDEAKVRAWDRVKAARDAAEVSSFTCDGRTYDSDKVRISGAALDALMSQVLGTQYSVDWTISDNSVVTLNGPQMMAVGAALSQHIEDAFEIARGLREQIDVATTVEQVATIGWP